MAPQVSSSTTTDIKKKIFSSISESIYNNVLSCNSSSSYSNKMEITGNNNKFGSIKQSITGQDLMTCIQNSSITATMKADIDNAIKSTVNEELSKSPGINTSVDVSNDTRYTEQITNLLNSFNVNNLATCVSNTLKSNYALVSGNSNDITSLEQTIDSNTITQCISNNSTINNSVQKIADTLSSDITSKKTIGIAAIGITGFIAIIVCACLSISLVSVGLLGYAKSEGLA
jgi:hypothetical protein